MIEISELQVYSLSCLGKETTKGFFGFLVKQPICLSQTHLHLKPQTKVLTSHKPSNLRVLRIRRCNFQ